MDQQNTHASSGPNGASTLHDLFALTDEQILEIEPEDQEAVASGPDKAGVNELRVASQLAPHNTGQPALPHQPIQEDGAAKNVITAAAARSSASTSHESPVTSHDAEPPPWLAAQMKDPWSGEEARELWNGVLQARQEAAAYREVFAKPEDARALKEIYPGGASEARAAAERARVLDEIDRAYFGAAGTSPEQSSAARAQLAAMMLREDPAAFREMVFAGLRALVESDKGASEKSVAQAGIYPDPVGRPEGVSSAVGATLGSPAVNRGATEAAGAPSGPGQASPAPTTLDERGRHESQVTSHDSRLAVYAAFEKAANEDLERSVGSAIERTLAHALPNVGRQDDSATVGARYIVPLHERLGAAIRQDIENALRGDRQLGEQVAQILSGRLDDEARGQVVRLIGERAQQLAPGAAKRVINDWTQTTLAAHRGKIARADSASTKREVAPASSDPRKASLPAGFPRDAGSQTGPSLDRSAMQPRVDYRKLSDEQILEL